MKESTLVNKVIIGVICAAVILYFAVYLALGFKPDLVTTTAYAYSVDIGTEASALLVRDEQVISTTGQYVDILLDEGEKVSKGGQIALIHASQDSLETRQTIQSLEAEIQQLEYSLSTGTQATNSSKLDEEVISSMVAIRSLAASGDLSTLEDSALHLRTMVFQRDYSYGNTQAATQIKQLISDKQKQLDSLNASLSQVSQTITSPASGCFSGEVDGFESLITPSMLSSLTMQQLNELLHKEVADPPAALGKVVTNNTWYLATLIDQPSVEGLLEGKTYKISFSDDYYGMISMNLERLVMENDQTMAIFSTNTNLSDTTLLRQQTVDIIAQQVEGIRIPRQALRVNTETVTDDQGNQSQVNSYGVYTVVGTQAEWQEVKVVYSDDDSFYLVQPVDETASSRLRAGDEVILNTTNITDGMVVRS
ncbi:hypothetical protein E0L15_10175 [Pseudoflavonifractor sp. SW1122]|uniref:HlyD family efflux transporter periplasmic adaptor subunit n=1 Tax=Pseudoflavonifractor sp. SW1122 TaxID=2530044 RepID=UPI0014398725|nr:HlyD family efflux transporter periplasmic adaptor subunit [Pseudoflavonifractor sp. SW1122]NJE74963.1 hypothetical protein [Pseudoflavonifractor sp. SW1122]